MARKQKVKMVLTENVLPEQAEFGTVFVCKDTQQVWITALNGDVLNLSDVLEGKTAAVRQVGPRGPKGEDSTVRGPQGERGYPGRDGKDGKDSVVAGPAGPRGEKGDTVAGPKGERAQNGKDGRDGVDGKDGQDGKNGKDSTMPGPAGRDGKDSTVPGPQGDDADITALSTQVAALQATVNALLDMNKKGADYISYLQEKVKRARNS